MTPSPRAARSWTRHWARRSKTWRPGLPRSRCSTGIPQYEAELAPLLETAYRLRTTRWPVLSMAARVAGREKMHAALAEQKRRRRFVVPPDLAPVRRRVALLLLAGTHLHRVADQPAAAPRTGRGTPSRFRLMRDGYVDGRRDRPGRAALDRPDRRDANAAFHADRGAVRSSQWQPSTESCGRLTPSSPRYDCGSDLDPDARRREPRAPR